MKYFNPLSHLFNTDKILGSYKSNEKSKKTQQKLIRATIIYSMLFSIISICFVTGCIKIR